MDLLRKWPYFLLLIGVGILFLLSNPLRWPASCIHWYILKITPIHSELNAVKKVIDNKDWEIQSYSTDQGFYDQRKSPDKTTGAMHIEASLGDYQGIPFEANVTVFWGFNDQGKLIDVWVWKTWDGL